VFPVFGAPNEKADDAAAGAATVVCVVGFAAGNPKPLGAAELVNVAFIAVVEAVIAGVEVPPKTDEEAGAAEAPKGLDVVAC
jgi:hypothetical protein